MTSAAGKYLIKMDLPLARREPSPPYRLRKALRLARRCPIALPKPRPARPLLAEATRAGFQFVGRAHRRKFTLNISAKTRTYRFQSQNGAIAVPFSIASAVISRAYSKVKQRMELRVIFFIFSLAAAISWLGTACLEVLGPPCGILPHTGRDSSSRRSPDESSQVLARPGRSPSVVLRVRQTFRWESHLTR
jgi:hypothetical protein